MKLPKLSRRRFVQAGGVGLLNLAVPGLVVGKDKFDATGKAVASKKCCIFVLLCGGPSHIDTWDLKPDAPSEIRGPYKPIRTKVPGMQLSELHPKLAQVTDQFCLIRSMTHPRPINNHFDAMHNLLSGQVVERVREGVPDDLPYIGSVVAKHLSNERNLLTNAWLIKCVGAPVFCAPNIGSGGYLGSSYAPVFIGSADNHPAMPKFKLPEIYEMGDPARMQERRKLLDALESDRLSHDAGGKDWGELRELAYDAMTRPEGRAAFDLKQEPVSVRERYGMHPLGQNLLLARRMVEAGVRFVTVNGWVGPAPGEAGGGPPSSSWDMHGGNMGMGNAFSTGSYGMGFCLPRLDQGLSALLTDLKERGMLNDTLVVAMGEFGRTPVILTQGPPGRQHWPQCFSAIVAGCGIRGGAVYGESDKTGSAPKSNPVTPQDLHATILHALGVPLNDLGKNTGIIRPPFSSGKPVMGLFG
ncbi:MAG: DUF1501 domain-containing protein [Proteobacteria bacterium]|nr:DUF1501 domain-containing protein [Verrucomicrobiota bacterium]NBU08468.1 DUF1501 domain-containing protein [Pseudomonadota bacterium]